MKFHCFSVRHFFHFLPRFREFEMQNLADLFAVLSKNNTIESLRLSAFHSFCAFFSNFWLQLTFLVAAYFTVPAPTQCTLQALYLPFLSFFVFDRCETCRIAPVDLEMLLESCPTLVTLTSVRSVTFVACPHGDSWFFCSLGEIPIYCVPSLSGFPTLTRLQYVSFFCPCLVRLTLLFFILKRLNGCEIENVFELGASLANNTTLTNLQFVCVSFAVFVV